MPIIIIYNTDGYSTNFYRKGLIVSTIFGTDPFKNLEKFMFHYGNGGDNECYLINYDLGGEGIQNPHIYFHNHNKICFSDVQNDFRDDPNILAKTLRIRKRNLPFKIK